MEKELYIPKPRTFHEWQNNKLPVNERVHYVNVTPRTISFEDTQTFIDQITGKINSEVIIYHHMLMEDAKLNVLSYLQAKYDL